MSQRRTRIETLIALLACCGAVAGCGGGSSPSTSRADVVAVAAAERAFLGEWAKATARGRERCESAPPKASSRCFLAVAGPAQGVASARLFSAVDKVMADGVGSKCQEALEEALATFPSIPTFAGETTAELRNRRSLVRIQSGALGLGVARSAAACEIRGVRNVLSKPPGWQQRGQQGNGKPLGER
jgi:hypothetical protein